MKITYAYKVFLFVLSGFSFSFSSLAQASSLATQNTNDPNVWTSTVNWNQDLNKDRPRAALKGLNLQYSYGLEAPDANSTSTSWIETDTYIAALDWEFGAEKLWTSSLALTISNQPVEKFSTTGLEFDLNRKFVFGEPKPQDKVKSKENPDPDQQESDEFFPSFNIGIKVGNTNLNQKSKVRKNGILQNDLTEPQLKTGVNAKYDYASFGALSSEYNGYKYNPSISTFIQYLNISQGSRLTGMNAAMGQLNVYDWTNKLIFYLGDNWEWDIFEEISESLVTGQTTYLYETTLDYKISKDFDIEVGIGQQQPINQLEGIFNLSYNY